MEPCSDTDIATGAANMAIDRAYANKYGRDTLAESFLDSRLWLEDYLIGARWPTAEALAIFDRNTPKSARSPAPEQETAMTDISIQSFIDAATEQDMFNRLGVTATSQALPALTIVFPRVNGVDCCLISIRDSGYLVTLAQRKGFNPVLKAQYAGPHPKALVSNVLEALRK